MFSKRILIPTKIDPTSAKGPDDKPVGGSGSHGDFDRKNDSIGNSSNYQAGPTGYGSLSGDKTQFGGQGGGDKTEFKCNFNVT